VECLQNDVKDLKDVHYRLMYNLSEYLQQERDTPVLLTAVWTPSTMQMVPSLCKEIEYLKEANNGTFHYRDANFYVRGTVVLSAIDKRVQPKITIRNRLRADRLDLAIPQITEETVSDTLPLERFCLLRSRRFIFEDIAALTHYIQSQGFRTRQPINLGNWNCPS
jgi:hypothetical protein